MQNRDGIVGSWQPPSGAPPARSLDDPANVALWDAAVRAHVLDFEMYSQLAFSSGAAGSNTVTVWHISGTPGAGGHAPPFQPLVIMKRPTPAVFKAQLEFLDRYADLRGDRGPEIITQIDTVRAFFGSIPYLRPDRTKWTLELLEAAHRMSILVEMRFKHAFASRRPIEYSPQVQPDILTPSHGTLPSGHACESFMAAVVLWMLLRESTIAPYRDVSYGEQLMRQASRIAINRTVAGMHFPIDSAAGALLGLTLGQYFVNRCTGAANYDAWSFDSAKYPEPSAKKPPPLDGDFYWRELYDVDAKPSPGQKAPQAPYDYAAKIGTQQIGNSSPLLAWLWNKAKAEWS